MEVHSLTAAQSVFIRLPRIPSHPLRRGGRGGADSCYAATGHTSPHTQPWVALRRTGCKRWWRPPAKRMASPYLAEVVAQGAAISSCRRTLPRTHRRSATLLLTGAECEVSLYICEKGRPTNLPHTAPSPSEGEPGGLHHRSFLPTATSGNESSPCHLAGERAREPPPTPPNRSTQASIPAGRPPRMTTALPGCNPPPAVLRWPSVGGRGDAARAPTGAGPATSPGRPSWPSRPGASHRRLMATDQLVPLWARSVQ